MAAPPRFADLIGMLAESGCRFVVVGGVAAVLEGAPEYQLERTIVSGAPTGRLVELKQVSGREKDLAVLPLLRKTLEERSS